MMSYYLGLFCPPPSLLDTGLVCDVTLCSQRPLSLFDAGLWMTVISSHMMVSINFWPTSDLFFEILCSTFCKSLKFSITSLGQLNQAQAQIKLGIGSVRFSLRQLMASWMVNQIVLFEQTNVLLFPIKIRLEMAEIQPKVAIQLAKAILGDQLVLFSLQFWASRVKLRLHAKFQLPSSSG